MRLISLSVVLFTFFSCNDENNEDVLTRPLIPAAIGNYWVYVDSIWNDDQLIEVSFDTVTIIDTFMLDGHIWWEVEGHRPLPFIYAEFAIRNDTIFSIQGSWTRELSIDYIPPPDTLVAYYSIYEGDLWIDRTAIKYPEPIIVGLGSFIECGQYITEDDPYYWEEYVYPGIGIIVSKTFRDSNWQWPYTRTRKLELIKYDVDN